MKMLGQDVVTKTEFDVFKLEEFEPIAQSISKRATSDEVTTLKNELDEVKKSNKKMIAVTLVVGAIAVLSFAVSVISVL